MSFWQKLNSFKVYWDRYFFFFIHRKVKGFNGYIVNRAFSPCLNEAGHFILQSPLWSWFMYLNLLIGVQGGGLTHCPMPWHRAYQIILLRQYFNSLFALLCIFYHFFIFKKFFTKDMIRKLYKFIFIVLQYSNFSHFEILGCPNIVSSLSISTL